METSVSNRTVPVLALRNLVLFPGMGVPIRVGRKQSILAIQSLGGGGPDTAGGLLIAVLQKPKEQKDQLAADELHTIGVLCQVERVHGDEKDGYQLVLRGIERVRVSSPFEKDGYLIATAEPAKEVVDADPKTVRALMDSVKTLAKQIVDFLPSGAEQMKKLVDGITDLDFLINIAAANIDITVGQKQELLEQASLKARALRLLELMQHVRDELQVRSEIQDKMSTKLGKFQREVLLREQLRAIQDELGESDLQGDGGQTDFRAKIKDAGMPENVEKVALDELRRLETLGNQSPETHVIRNYLDLLVAMPWPGPRREPEVIDLSKARETLNTDHYGLEKIKKRIVEHLATMKLKEGGRGVILLFIGPPGVGKTSLGQSIARALGRRFVRASLGGVRDDAEIRGHRRTYIGAMPGRIVQGIKRAGVANPVFLLDEIDKLGQGFQGDPAAALLEVLDPEQNSTFTDHYMDVPYDLSKVLFIATANSLESIPGPLLDRMEVIELSGYTTAEKMHIAENHLLPKQLEEHGLDKKQLEIDRDALMDVITSYTREAGVRDLQRQLAAICRGAAIRIVDGCSQTRIHLNNLEEFLGPRRFEHDVTEKSTPPGVTTGLAWTPVGGEILFVESALMPGSGRLILTGQLGEVMKESAQIALSLIRSRLPQVSASLEFGKRDLHIHVPAGAIPKDGPSAGITMLTSIASLFTGQPVDPKLAMTGEITLRGTVTPVGGVKEKIMAAHRAGVEKVVLSRKNERDLRDVPQEVKSKLEFIFVEDVADVLRAALRLDIPALDPNTGLWGERMSPEAGNPAPLSMQSEV